MKQLNGGTSIKKPPAELGALLVSSGYLRCQIDQFT